MQTFSSDGILEVKVNGYQIFNISVTTSKSSQIVLKSISDGEYGNQFQVVSEVKGKQLQVALSRTVPYETPDDKRNAHKVIAAELQITMPENLSLAIKSDVGSATIKGLYNELKINLAQGSCTVDGMARLATIKTTDEPIFVITKDAIISTDSKSGLVDFPSDMLGLNLWRLTTISGDITVKKREN
ncbi:hypothetical protein DFQ05_1409 [Winogradskyella wandonensis]|uniref:Adhesin domain-containing protein n=1 Tax=Winogradskyella wandonensis TaxID=1442586 RepID=A0A4R1KSQ0_9FLAO|nr:hypothetical protein [Winogradskyella wandonensis]TCK67630.1 hypothetical protein DFQ05_1409 [Winogradskyella wandonensis]